MKVVIIDDSLFMRRLIRSALRESQPEVQIEEFSDATVALAALPGLAADLVTLDILMPGMTGVAFLTRLDEIQPHPRVIVISADVQKTVRQRCLELGATDFIEKPITPEKLQLALGKLIAA